MTERDIHLYNNYNPPEANATCINIVKLSVGMINLLLWAKHKWVLKGTIV
jgi:hypothetical protein